MGNKGRESKPIDSVHSGLPRVTMNLGKAARRFSSWTVFGGKIALWGSVLFVDSGGNQVLRRDIAYIHRRERDKKPSVYVYGQGDPYVTVHVTRLERDALSFANYNLVPTASLRLTTPRKMSLWVDKVSNTTNTSHLTKFLTSWSIVPP